jgi:hypothetical protein
MKTEKSAPVLDRLMAPLGDCLAPESARVDDLAGRHIRGVLTPEEQAEYGRAASIIHLGN